MSTFTWLHLTDFHHGIAGGPRLWPAQRQAFFDDLRDLVPKVGGIDAVFFTGDLVQRGSKKEFDGFSSELDGVRGVLSELGSEPKLFFIPGNHDLERPAQDTAALREIRKYGLRAAAVRDDLFGASEKLGEHRRCIAQAFKQYSNWWRRAVLPGLAGAQTGRLPGDFACELQLSGLSIGVIGLNSSAFQLSSDDYERHLVLDVAQMHAVCGGDAATWVRSRDFTFLLTHHPVAWLANEQAGHFHDEIGPHVHVHLHGHLHVGDIAVGSPFLGNGLLSLQGRSLFGLESFKTAAGTTVERTHGYAIGRLEVAGPSGRPAVRLWLRCATRIGAGGWKFAPDPRYPFDPQTEATEPIAVRHPRLSRTELPRLTHPVPPGLRAPVHVQTGKSLRLDQAASRILELVDQGERIVALRGNPGDGKTQVLRQIAASRGGCYVELGGGSDPNAALREALSVIVESFEEPACAHRSVPAICATVRKVLYKHFRAPLIVLDAVDGPCAATTLTDLLDAELGGAVVVAGPGVLGVPEIELGPSGPAEFEQAFGRALSMSELEPAVCERLRLVGESVDFSPLRAEVVAEAVRGAADLEAALSEYTQAVVPTPAGRFAESAEKVWQHLSQNERTRVGLVAVLGEPGIPASWLPGSTALGSQARAPLLRVSADAGVRSVSAHRLVAEFAASKMRVELQPTLAELLESWVRDYSLLDELKARGPRARALVRGFRLLSEQHRAAASGRLKKEYVDVATAPTEELLWAHISLIAPNALSVAELPLEVVGELVEQIPRSAPGILQEVRQAAERRVIELVKSGSRASRDDSEVANALATALHHGCKALIRGKDDPGIEIATEVLKDLAERCAELHAATRQPRFLIELAQARLQLCRSRIPDGEKMALLRASLEDAREVLPSYLRLALISAALGLTTDARTTSFEAISLITDGLALCSGRTPIHTQVEFLRVAANQCDRINAGPAVWMALAESAQALVPQVVVEELGNRGATSLGHALLKGAARDATRAGVDLILSALGLFDLLLETANIQLLGRLGAALRELGFAEEAKAMARGIHLRSAGYFETFDLAKALRATGRFQDAVAVVEAERARQPDTPNGHNNRAALGDELAKSLVRIAGRTEEVAPILRENAENYRQRGLEPYATRCERWAENPTAAAVQEGGLAEDEWRASTRHSLLRPDEKHAVLSMAERARTRLVALGAASTVSTEAQGVTQGTADSNS